MPETKDEDIKNRLKDLIMQADSKSEELLIGDFKQYFDEEFSSKVWELINE